MIIKIIGLIFFCWAGSSAGFSEKDISGDERYIEVQEKFSQQKFDDALTLLSELKSDYGKSNRLWRAFGHVYYKLNQFEESAQAYRMALEYGDELDLFADNYVVALMRSKQEGLVMGMGDELVGIKDKSPFIVRIICLVCVQTKNEKLFDELLLTLSKEDLNDERNPFVIAATAKYFVNLRIGPRI